MKITSVGIEAYLSFLREQEKSGATIQKYKHDINEAKRFFGDRELTKTDVIEWKESLILRYAAASVNTMLAAVNGFFEHYGRNDLRVNQLKIQRNMFADEGKELTKDEYSRLVRAAGARKDERVSLVMQTICSTGIRVSELCFITAEAVARGTAAVFNKGKRRTVFLPDNLCAALKRYLKKQKRTAGPVFVTKTGKPLHRTNIWKAMKALCQSAGVSESKVFPHNLRHLFARTYYKIEKDLLRLADILGHSNVNTTRIYTMESGAAHARQIAKTGLFLDAG